MQVQDIHQLLEDYVQLFQITSEQEELRGAHALLDEQLHQCLTEQELGDELEEHAEIQIKTNLLKFLSESPQISKEIQAAMGHYAEAQEAGHGSYTLPDNETPLSDHEVSLMHEAASIWQRLPHVLVHANWDLIKSAAAKHHDPTRIEPELEFEDLISVGAEALLLAAQKMYEKPRPDFRKFASDLLSERIKNHQQKRYPVPYKTRKKLQKLREAREELGMTNRQDEVAAKELSQAAGLNQEEMRGLFEVESIWGAGIFVDVGDKIEELEIPDLSPDALSLLIDHETSMRMSEAMTNLSDMQRNVILQIYFRDHSFRETAKNLNVSLSVVKKHHRNAMAKLKGHID